MLEILYKKTEDLIPYINNTRTHTEKQINQVVSSIREFGFCNPILIDEKNNIIAGHCRLLAAQKEKMDTVPCIILKGLSRAQRKAYIIADNKLAENAGWDEDLLKLEIESLKEMDFDLDLLGFDEDELSNLEQEEDLQEESKSGNMNKIFGFSPFTVFNAREGRWQSRKKEWLSNGIKSEEGRGVDLTYGDNLLLENETSVFDPVLCELAYKWFSPNNGLILDPFAGGSVRGIVASLCQRQYIGNDLSKTQVEANRNQALNICKDIFPVWTIGDSKKIKSLVGDIKADAIFSCPPYANLEVYSKDPDDISNMTYDKFLEAYRIIISECYDLLKNDRFAVWVVGELRDKKGNYYNFVGDTIKAFTDAGFNYYNEAILVTCVGSLPLRAGKQMKASRKLGKCHQNILIFVKGDGKKAAQNCGDIDIQIEELNEVENA